MNIGQLARITGVSADTLRYYEKESLLESRRGANGYRQFGDDHVARVRFVRSAQTLGFSLAEIRRILPQMAAGRFGRTEIEGRLRGKMEEIDQHLRQLRALKRELQATLDSLRCSPGRAVSTEEATARTARRAPGALRKSARVAARSRGGAAARSASRPSPGPPAKRRGHFEKAFPK